MIKKKSHLILNLKLLAIFLFIITSLFKDIINPLFYNLILLVLGVWILLAGIRGVMRAKFQIGKMGSPTHGVWKVGLSAQFMGLLFSVLGVIMIIVSFFSLFN